MLKKLSYYFEKWLWNSRLLVLFAVIFSGLLSIVLFVITSMDVISIAHHSLDYAGITDFDAKKAFKTEMVAHTVGAIDGYLLSTILLIFSVGLYELFIGEIHQVQENNRQARVLVIKDLDDLKGKLAKVILMILVVTFFEVSLSMTFTDPLDLVYFSLGIFLVSLALYFGNKSH